MYKYKSLQVGQLPREYLPFLQNLVNLIIKNIWNKNLMTTYAFAWINVAPVASL